jgi:hypothetical protein
LWFPPQKTSSDWLWEIHWRDRFARVKRGKSCEEMQPWQQDTIDDLRPRVLLRRHARGAPEGTLLGWVSAQGAKQANKLPRIGRL